MWTDEEINNIIFLALKKCHDNHNEPYTREMFDQDTLEQAEDHTVMLEVIREVLNLVAPKK